MQWQKQGPKRNTYSHTSNTEVMAKTSKDSYWLSRDFQALFLNSVAYNVGDNAIEEILSILQEKESNNKTFGAWPLICTRVRMFQILGQATQGIVHVAQYYWEVISDVPVLGDLFKYFAFQIPKISEKEVCVRGSSKILFPIKSEHCITFDRGVPLPKYSMQNYAMEILYDHMKISNSRKIENLFIEKKLSSTFLYFLVPKMWHKRTTKFNVAVVSETNRVSYFRDECLHGTRWLE